MRLTAAQRSKLTSNQFALPGRRYPVPDASHARNALARAAQNATPTQKTRIAAKVHRKYPKIGKPDFPTPGDTRDATVAQFVRKHGR